MGIFGDRNKDKRQDKKRDEKPASGSSVTEKQDGRASSAGGHSGGAIARASAAGSRSKAETDPAETAKGSTGSLFGRSGRNTTDGQGPKATAKAMEKGGAVATIGKSIIFKGELTGDEDLEIDGVVEGDVQLPSHELTIGAHGKVTDA